MHCIKYFFILFFINFINVAHSVELVSYLPPFGIENKFLISQGFGGAVTHQSAVNYYAIDLVMPVGAWVCAARDGVVSTVYDGKGWFFDDTKNSNYVRIQHANNQFSDYQHLLPGSIKVQVGQALKARQCFAQVGNTGNTTGPHLHFAVLVEKKGELVSIPFKFIDPQGRSYTPEYLQWVRN